MTAEELLSGGFVAEVVRVGDTVRRTAPANADFVAARTAGVVGLVHGWHDWLLTHRPTVDTTLHP